MGFRGQQRCRFRTYITAKNTNQTTISIKRAITKHVAKFIITKNVRSMKMKGLTLGAIIGTWIMAMLLYANSFKMIERLDELIKLNTPEAIQLIVPDKPLLEDK